MYGVFMFMHFVLNLLLLLFLFYNIIYYSIHTVLGGGNDIGETMQGFQIWINVPKENKMNDPKYGTVPNEDMPLISIGRNGGRGRNGRNGRNGNGVGSNGNGNDGDGDSKDTCSSKGKGYSQARILAGNVGDGVVATSDDDDDVENNNVDATADATITDDSNDVVGPFETKQKVQMIDFEIGDNDTIEFTIENGLDTAMLYVYEGSLKSINGYNNKNENDNENDNDYDNDDGDGDDISNNFNEGAIVLLDADSSTKRKISLQAASVSSSDNDNDNDNDNDDKKKKKKNLGAGVMLFAGKKLKESIVWHGPIVMNTKEEINQTFRDMRNGKFPPKRVNWNYKVLKSKNTTEINDK
jgi:redox-sensitive bicupin YhaK (pirin superfamily)